jgi:hypothetical protein
MPFGAFNTPGVTYVVVFIQVVDIPGTGRSETEERT